MVFSYGWGFNKTNLDNNGFALWSSIDGSGNESTNSHFARADDNLVINAENMRNSGNEWWQSMKTNWKKKR